MQANNDDKNRGLICYIYRHDAWGNCSNGGISSKFKVVTLIDIGAGIFEPVDDRPAVRLIKRTIFGKPYLHAEPVERPEGMVGPMAGGAFIYSSDSRFPSQYPIALHDRFETVEQYNSNSN